MQRLALFVALVVGGITATCGLLHAGGFNSDSLLSLGNGQGSRPTLTLDFTDNVIVVWLEGDEIYAAFGSNPASGSFPVISDGEMHADPDIAVDTFGLVTLVYETPAIGNPEIFFADNPGGPFAPPMNLSLDPELDRRARVSAFGSERHVVWERIGPGTDVMIADNLGLPQLLAVGEKPVVVAGSGGAVHVAYERDGDIFYREKSGGSFGPEVTISDASDFEQDVAIDIDGNGNAHLVFEAEGEIRYVRPAPGSGFLAPQPVLGTTASRPQIAMQGSSAHIVFEEAGDLQYITAVGSILSPLTNITNTVGVTEERARIDVDSMGFLHVAFERTGEVHYVNNVPIPEASFSATPTSGEMPLTVQFMDLSEGVVTSWEWDFGDGTTSFDQHPEYTYEVTGNYTVSLTAFGPGGSSTSTMTNLIQVANPSNVLRIPPATMFQGQQGYYLPVLATHPEAIQGYQISLSWDCSVFDLVDTTLDATAVSSLDPEFILPNLDDQACTYTLGVVFDLAPPFDGRTLDGGVDHRLVNLVMDVDIAAPAPSTAIVNLEHGLGDPPLFNIYTVQGISVVPVLEDGVVSIVGLPFPPPVLFIRGDADGTGALGLADGIFLLSYLFQSGAEPPCLDAADVNDDGLLGLPDAISLLTFLFSGGSVPAVPYPNFGLDPTPDPLGDC